MFCKIYSGGIRGVNGFIVGVEVDITDGLPGYTMVGMLSSEVKEAGERVRSAIKNVGFRFPPKRITVNLSPADVRKEGSFYDLGIAAAVLTNFDCLSKDAVKDLLILGELSLDGTVNPVNGVLPIICAAKERGLNRCIVPWQNAKEGAVVEGILVYGVRTLKEMLYVCNKQEEQIPVQFQISQYLEERQLHHKVDFSEVNGQQALRRAAEVASAGMHNILMVGPPGSGKTMIARRLPTILPSLSISESIELTKIYSVAGCLPAEEPLMTERPFRSPHHTISPIALTGGGRTPRPGEISLSNFGVLFLDEIPEFQKATLEILRQPMEDRKVIVSRVSGSYEFPTNFMFAAAMNPCRCGYYPDRNRCKCRIGEINRYLGRISRPLLDRIDICIEATELTYHDLDGTKENESSQMIRLRVEDARQVQKERYQGLGIHCNSELTDSQMRQYCRLDKEESKMLEQAYKTFHLTARGMSRILKVARTIADLDGKEKILIEHLSEAICYRSMDKKNWNIC